MKCRVERKKEGGKSEENERDDRIERRERKNYWGKIVRKVKLQ